jgi:ABC-type transport system substrate-binding protein
MVMGITQIPEGYDPAGGTVSEGALSVFKAIYDPMTVIDEEGNAVPYLIEAIEPNEDFTYWTITLRDGVRFHNGDELTPQIVATHLKSLQLSVLTGFVFDNIAAVAVVDEAAGPQHEAGEISDEEYEVMRRQVIVTMDQPWSTFPALLASYQAGFVPHPGLAAGELDKPIGTGPFVFDEESAGNVTVTRNDAYWREGLPYLDEVEFRSLSDPASRHLAVKSGDIDLMISDAPSQVAELLGEGVGDELQLVEDTSEDDEQLIMLNTQSGPTADRDVRRALQLATDRELLNQTLYGGQFTVADTPFTPESFWYTDPGWPQPDPDAAAELVESWESENGPLEIDLVTYNTTEDLNIGQALQAQWEDAGIDTEVEALDESAMISRITVGEFTAILNTALNGEDPDQFYPFLDPENIGEPGELSINFTRYRSDTSEEVMIGARKIDDPDERKEAYGRLWKDMAENAPYLFLWHGKQILVADDDVQGLGTFETPDGVSALDLAGGSLFMTQLWRVT